MSGGMSDYIEGGASGWGNILGGNVLGGSVFGGDGTSPLVMVVLAILLAGAAYYAYKKWYAAPPSDDGAVGYRSSKREALGSYGVSFAD